MGQPISSDMCKEQPPEIIHGHGNVGMIHCDHPQSGAWSGLYAYPVTLSNSNDATLANYRSNTLSKHKLIVFITCNSAQPYNGYSMAEQCVDKGAACSIGFYNEVSMGGEWLKEFVGQLHNRYTVDRSIDIADDFFNKKYSYMQNNEFSPTYYGNLCSFGNTNTIVRVN